MLLTAPEHQTQSGSKLDFKLKRFCLLSPLHFPHPENFVDISFIKE